MPIHTRIIVITNFLFSGLKRFDNPCDEARIWAFSNFKKMHFQNHFLTWLKNIFRPDFFVRDPKGPLHGFRASRVPLAIDYVESWAVEHFEIAKISEIHENGAGAQPSFFWTSWFAIGPILVDFRKPTQQIVFFTHLARLSVAKK